MSFEALVSLALGRDGERATAQRLSRGALARQRRIFAGGTRRVLTMKNLPAVITVVGCQECHSSSVPLLPGVWYRHERDSIQSSIEYRMPYNRPLTGAHKF